LKGGEKMRRVCCICGIFYGFKEPLEDDSETHGLCPECFENEMAKLKSLEEIGTEYGNKRCPIS
jgi:hypothetical protein